MYNARTFSNDTKSEAPAVGGKHGKGVDGLFEKRELSGAATITATRREWTGASSECV